MARITMTAEPKVRNNICLDAHPLGCLEQVRAQIRYASTHRLPDAGPPGPSRALVIGSSNGYGLAARIAAAFATRQGAATLGVSYEKPPARGRPGSAGWYNERAFVREAAAAGLDAAGVNGDAFSDEVKDEVVGLAHGRTGPLDLVVYSIAAPRRLDPSTGELYASAIKPIGRQFRGRTVDFMTGASAVIPGVPLYTSPLYRVMKDAGTHEGCIQQMVRLYREHLYGPGPLRLDDRGRIRLDDREMRPEVQREVRRLWDLVDERSLEELSDIRGFREEFLRHHGFGMPGVDYGADIDPMYP